MIARRKKAFYRLVGMLRDIEADLDNIALVREFNLSLLKEVLRDEAHVNRHKAASKELRQSLKHRLSKAEAATVKAKIKRLEGYIEKYHDQIYIWKSIGDGLAFAYIDSMNIKHTFFDTESMSPKQTAGMISGKDGLKHELGWLLSALEHGVPAVLCDLTNVIRYGDICLLGASDPVPLEVKSQRRLNQRGLRQKAKLDKLQGFLENDFAEEFRGSPQVQRTAITIPYESNIDALNACTSNAVTDGQCVICPEPGVIYAAVTDGDLLDALGSMPMEFPLMSHINMDKSEKTWAPYLSFINSIRDINQLYAFVTGELSIIVCLDVGVICEKINIPGWNVAFVDDHDIGLVITEQDGSGRLAVSRQMMGRMIYEFMSLKWFTSHEQDSMGRVLQGLMEGKPISFADETANLTAMLDAMPKLVEKG